MNFFKKKPNYNDTSKYVKIISISHFADHVPDVSDFEGNANITTKQNDKLTFQRVLRHISKPIVCTTVHCHENKDLTQIYFTGKKTEKIYLIHELEGLIRNIQAGDIFEICEIHEEYKRKS